MSLAQIRSWLCAHQRRQRLGEAVPSICEIADRAGISRQTLYAVLRDERSEFGEVAQLRVSRAIVQISANPAYQHSKLMYVRFTTTGVRLGFANSGMNQ